MAIAQVQVKTKTAAAANVTIAGADGWAAPTANNLLIAIASGNVGTVPTITGFAADVTCVLGSGAKNATILSKLSDGTETSLTASDTLATHTIFYIYEYSGLATSSWLDKTNHLDNQVTGTSVQTGSTGTLSQSSELVIALALINLSDGGTETVDSGFTTPPPQNSIDQHVVLASQLITSATTALNPTFGWTTTRTRGGAIATYNSFVAAATVGPTRMTMGMGT